MKAVRIFAFGGPEQLLYDDYPMPRLQSDGVLVRVMATTVSRWDVKYRNGDVQKIGLAMTRHGGLAGRNPFPMPMQLGRDAAGIVAEVGASVTRWKPGDRVVGLVHPENPNSIETMRGLGNLSTGVDLPGHTMFGGNAQYVARPQSYWLPISPALDFDIAASSMWSCSTAHHIVVGRLGVRMNDTVLITGAAGGMGTATMQMCRLSGARVIAVTRNLGKADALRAAGADVVVKADADDVRQQIYDLSDGQGVDRAVDFSGVEAMMRLCIDATRLGGTFCPVGGELAQLPLRVSDLVNREMNVHGVRASTLNDQRTVVDLLEKGRLRVPVHATLPLSRVREAHVLMESTDLIGRIVLRPWEN